MGVRIPERRPAFLRYFLGRSRELRAEYLRPAERTFLVENGVAQLPDGRFDAVVSVGVLEHVDDLNAYLSDIFRLVKPGGAFVWTTPCGNRLSVEHAYKVLTRQIDPTPEGYRRWRWEDPTHVRRMRTGELTGVLRQQGFSDVSYRFRAHFFSFVCTGLERFRVTGLNRLMKLDYSLFRRFPNGASMVGCARKPAR